MKSLFIKSISLALITVGLWSCKKEETKIVSNVSPAGTLTASSTSINLVQANAAQPAVTLTFPLVTVTGYPIPVTSTLQFDVKGKNFSAPTEIVVNKTSYSPTISQVNAMLLALGIKIGVSSQVEVRLKSAPAPNSVTYSNVITLTATPYLSSSWVYVPGAYQDWTPATADSLVSVNSDGIYTGVILFQAGKLPFKITPKKNFDVAYGDAGAGTTNTSSDNFSALAAAGTQRVTIDLNKKTWAIAIVKTWSIIGSATPKGWDFDTDLKFVNDGKGMWKTTAALVAGEMKFREDHDWANNFGGSGGDAVSNGGNIKVTDPGNYTITLDIANQKYTLVKN